MSKAPKRLPRWGTRAEGMAHGKFGPTYMNQLMHEKKIIAKKDGGRVKIDLNSIDDFLEALPNVGDE
jgi:hypothetical protein